MPYPFRLGCRLCRELSRRLIAREFPEPAPPPLPPAVSPWDTLIGPRTHQVGTFFPKNAWAGPGGTIDLNDAGRKRYGRDRRDDV